MRGRPFLWAPPSWALISRRMQAQPLMATVRHSPARPAPYLASNWPPAARLAPAKGLASALARNQEACVSARPSQRIPRDSHRVRRPACSLSRCVFTASKRQRQARTLARREAKNFARRSASGNSRARALNSSCLLSRGVASRRIERLFISQLAGSLRHRRRRPRWQRWRPSPPAST